MTTSHPLTQDELKALVGQAALQYVVPGGIVGVGTGSTVNKFIDVLAGMVLQRRVGRQLQADLHHVIGQTRQAHHARRHLAHRERTGKP